jgi:pyruvate-ferredoxin/flavodoxin oxidoreductase
MYIANATGCSSIWGGSAPASPYTVNHDGHGPAWQNSLFEDNAEFGLGMYLGVTARRERIEAVLNNLLATEAPADVKAAAEAWIANKEEAAESKKASADLVAAIEKADDAANAEAYKEILEAKDILAKKSFWIFGGDGWAYDIGFGGLDHVLASGEDVNVLVLDTEVYSNTGGQSSKSTPAGAVAKFAASGKKLRKKDLGMIAKSYGYVYVAQVAMGANQAQYLKAIKEAEAYPGPSLVICYAPCINHGIKVGMGRTQHEEKLAVECGYWQLYRYNPAEEEAGQNGFHLDSKEPDWSKFQSFIMGEVRYNSLLKTFPEEAKELFAKTEQYAKLRYEGYKKLSEEK